MCCRIVAIAVIFVPVPFGSGFEEWILIREVFHKAYPANVEIRYITTEYVVKRIHNGSGSTLNSVSADPVSEVS